MTSTKAIQQLKFTDNDFASKAPFKVKNTGKSTLYVKVMIEGIPLVGDQSAAANNLKLTVKYRDMAGRYINRDKLTQGMEFKAEVTVYNPGKKGLYKEMALMQIFPSGWEIHNARMDGENETNQARYQDIRDDRVYTYYELAPNKSKKFLIQLNATYLGKFYLPTCYSEAMYDHLISAKTPGKWVEVVKEK